MDTSFCRIRVSRLKVCAFLSYSPKPLVLRFGQQPRIFDLCGWASAAENADDFSGGVGLAVDVGFVGVGRRVAGDDNVGQRQYFVIGWQWLRVGYVECCAGRSEERRVGKECRL